MEGKRERLIFTNTYSTIGFWVGLVIGSGVGYLYGINSNNDYRNEGLDLVVGIGVAGFVYGLFAGGSRIFFEPSINEAELDRVSRIRKSVWYGFLSGVLYLWLCSCVVYVILLILGFIDIEGF